MSAASRVTLTLLRRHFSDDEGANWLELGSGTKAKVDDGLWQIKYTLSDITEANQGMLSEFLKALLNYQCDR